MDADLNEANLRQLCFWGDWMRLVSTTQVGEMRSPGLAAFCRTSGGLAAQQHGNAKANGRRST